MEGRVPLWAAGQQRKWPRAGMEVASECYKKKVEVWMLHVIVGRDDEEKVGGSTSEHDIYT